MALSRPRARAFSFIEVMITVTIVGILALLATVAYRHWVHTAYISEAQEMVNNIRTAQESFRSENGGYLKVSHQLGPPYDYPALTPGNFKTEWGGSCGGCEPGVTWSMLNVKSSAPVAFGYSVVADNTNVSQAFGLHSSGQPLPIADTMPAPWYLIEADGDLDGNGVFAHVYGMSTTNQIFIDNEGE
jgi:prepilin-type N-terminal cleavage/methylation domain-containing protein